MIDFSVVMTVIKWLIIVSCTFSGVVFLLGAWLYFFKKDNTSIEPVDEYRPWEKPY